PSRGRSLAPPPSPRRACPQAFQSCRLSSMVKAAVNGAKLPCRESLCKSPRGANSGSSAPHPGPLLAGGERESAPLTVHSMRNVFSRQSPLRSLSPFRRGEGQGEGQGSRRGNRILRTVGWSRGRREPHAEDSPHETSRHLAGLLASVSRMSGPARPRGGAGRRRRPEIV